MKWILILCGIPFFSGGAVAVGREALRNEAGMVINGVIEMGPWFVTGLYWVFSAFAVAGLALYVWAGFLRLANDRRVAFGPTSVAVPAARLPPDVVEIAYGDITGCSFARVNSNRFVHITHPGGTHTVLASMLPSNAVFDEVCQLLVAKVQAARLGLPSP